MVVAIDSGDMFQDTSVYTQDFSTTGTTVSSSNGPYIIYDIGDYYKEDYFFDLEEVKYIKEGWNIPRKTPIPRKYTHKRVNFRARNQLPYKFKVD